MLLQHAGRTGKLSSYKGALRASQAIIHMRGGRRRTPDCGGWIGRAAARPQVDRQLRLRAGNEDLTTSVKRSLHIMAGVSVMN